MQRVGHVSQCVRGHSSAEHSAVRSHRTLTNTSYSRGLGQVLYLKQTLQLRRTG